jgi:membrane-bound lytic murein transglycosylase D
MPTQYNAKVNCGIILMLCGTLLSGCASPPKGNIPETLANSDDSDNFCDDRAYSSSLSSPHLTDPLGFRTQSIMNRNTPVNLWDRVRLGFRLNIPNDWRIRREMSRITSHPESLERGVKRAEPYLHFIVDEAEKRNMPLEIALLPAVESGFQPHARSNKAAVGLWQFIPSTAREKGLKNNWWYEGRCDITASTRAALDYLQELADMFNGDWELALAAYNAGPGRVQRAIQANEARGLETDFWSLPLPTETRNYVPKLLAIARILRNPEYHGVNLKPLPNAPYFSEVNLSRPLSLDQAAKLANVDQATLKKLNPGIRRGIAGIGGNYPLLLPVNRVAKFEERLSQLTPNISLSSNLQPRNYRVRPGDGVTQIAQQFGISSSALRAANGLSDWQIRAGQNLVIPFAADAPKISKLKPNIPIELDETDNEPKVATISPTRQIPVTNVATQAKLDTHIVQPGEFLRGIARNYNLDHVKLAKWNNLTPTSGLVKGQILRLQPPINESKSKTFSYQVRKGDSLKQIAERFNVSIADLRRWNDIEGDVIRPGMRLTLHPPTSLSSSL